MSAACLFNFTAPAESKKKQTITQKYSYWLKYLKKSVLDC